MIFYFILFIVISIYIFNISLQTFLITFFLFVYNNHFFTVIKYQVFLFNEIAQSAGAVEYTDCISAEG